MLKTLTSIDFQMVFDLIQIIYSNSVLVNMITHQISNFHNNINFATLTDVQSWQLSWVFQVYSCIHRIASISVREMIHGKLVIVDKPVKCTRSFVKPAVSLSRMTKCGRSVFAWSIPSIIMVVTSFGCCRAISRYFWYAFLSSLELV